MTTERLAIFGDSIERSITRYSASFQPSASESNGKNSAKSNTDNLFIGFKVICLWIIRYVKAIDIQPPAIGISLRLLCNKAYLGSYPLAFAHGKRCSCLGELLAVTTESEPNNALIYPHSEIYFFVNSKLIIVIVLPRFGQISQQSDRSCMAFISIFAGHLLQNKPFTYPFYDQSRIVFNLAVAVKLSDGVFCNKRLGVNQKLSLPLKVKRRKKPSEVGIPNHGS